MNYSEFQAALLDLLNARTSPGFSVRTHTVMKNNRVEKTGLMLYDETAREAVISPVVYTDMLYQAYLEGKTMTSVSDSAWELLQVPAPPELGYDSLMDRDFILEHAVLRLVSRERNGESLKDLVTKDFLDLAVTVGIVLIEDESVEAMTVLSRDLLDRLGIPEDLLFRTAAANSAACLGDCVSDMNRFLFGTGADADIAGEDAAGADNRLYILTNRCYCYGASAMLYSGRIRQLSRQLGCDLLILPSSVHELILMPDRGNDTEALKKLVYGINRCELRPEDILSDSVYRYSREKDSIALV